jgi:endonuclease/exonuclease/phosphatase family metal-dependent hydrolase
MSNSEATRIRLMTYNIGAVKKAGYSFEGVLSVIEELQPDILAIQESVEMVDLDDAWVRQAASIAERLGYGDHHYFGAAISMREHFTSKKAAFVDGLFEGWQDWRLGNALVSRWPFVRLGDYSKPGAPQNLPLYRPLQYEGTRDTDPRSMVIGRIDLAPFYPYLIGTHFTTLVGERTHRGRIDVNVREDAHVVRWKQAQRLLDVVQRRLLDKGEVVFLLGDLNAIPGEACMSGVLEAGGRFTRLIPDNPQPTHPKIAEPVDHILVHGGDRRIEYRCWIVDDDECRKASDHLPVVADIEVYDDRSTRAQEMGKGVYSKEVP